MNYETPEGCVRDEDTSLTNGRIISIFKARCRIDFIYFPREFNGCCGKKCAVSNGTHDVLLFYVIIVQESGIIKLT